MAETMVVFSMDPFQNINCGTKREVKFESKEKNCEPEMTQLLVFRWLNKLCDYSFTYQNRIPYRNFGNRFQILARSLWRHGATSIFIHTRAVLRLANLYSDCFSNLKTLYVKANGYSSFWLYMCMPQLHFPQHEKLEDASIKIRHQSFPNWTNKDSW